MEVRHYESLLGIALNFFGIKSHRLFQANKLLSTKNYARRVDAMIKSENIDVVHAHNLYYGYVASFLKARVPVIFTPMGSDIIIHAQKNKIYKHMAYKAFNRAAVVTGDSLLLKKEALRSELALKKLFNPKWG